MKNDALGDRMKGYENAYRLYLPKRLPVIIRVDGKAFHSYTRGLEKPWDSSLELTMYKTAQFICGNIQGAQVAYVQSDEISILVHNYKRLTSDSWFGNNLQKMVSVSASLATAGFNSLSTLKDRTSPALFDSRVWILPEAEVNNYFVWRQKDAVRNSISSLAQSLYSHSELQHKNSSDMQEMCFQKGVNWNDLPIRRKRGICIVKDADGFWGLDLEIPTFSQDPTYINKYLETLE